VSAASKAILVAAILAGSCGTGAAAAQGPGRDRWILSGDLRLRGEYDVDRAGLPNRARPRLRFRVALEHLLLSRLYVGARLVTAPSAADPNSTHQNVGQGFQTYRLALDRAYLRWFVPIDAELAIHVGKFGHPFTTGIVYDELVWDADVQPDGVAAVFRPIGSVRIVAAQYLVLHRSPGKSVGLAAAQAAWSGRIAGPITGGVAVGGYAYDRPDEDGARILARENQGNALVTATLGDTLAFASDFDLLHLVGWLRYSPGRLPVAVGGQYVANTSAAAGFDDDGFAVAAEVGALDRPGSWRVHYQYQEIGQEAVFSPFAQDDLLDAANFRGHLTGVAVQALPGVTVYLWSVWSARQRPRVDTLQKRFRVDLNLAF
jgi:hypothetical protein